MACSISLSGSVSVGGNGCGCSGYSGGGSVPSSKTMGLSFSCVNSTYGAVSSTDCPVAISTTDFIELPGTASIGDIQLLSLKSSGLITLRLDASSAQLVGSGGVFPVTFAGTEELGVDINDINFTLSFSAQTLTLTEVVESLNLAAVSQGFTYLPFTESNGQIAITATGTGSDSLVLITNAVASIGFPNNGEGTEGGGTDLSISGTAILQFDATNAPSKIEVSGSAQVEVLAAGTAPS